MRTFLYKGLCLALAASFIVPPPNLLFAQDVKPGPAKKGGLATAPSTHEGTILDLEPLDQLAVDPRSGGLKLQRVDLVVGEGEQAFKLHRTYRPWAGDLLNLGTHWVTDFDMHLDMHKSGTFASMVHEDGFRTFFRKNKQGKLVSMSGRVARLEVLKDGYVVRAMGDERVYRFDAKGWLLSRQGPGSLWVNFEYDAKERLSKVKGVWGELILKRDAQGVLASVHAPGGQVVRYTRDKAGNLTKVVRGTRYETYGYDGGSRLAHLAGGKALIGYDAVGRVIDMRGGGVHPLKVRYQHTKGTWALTTTITRGKNQIETFRYARNKRKIEKVDAEGRKSLTELDRRQRLVRFVGPDGRVLTQSYDKWGRILAKVTPQGTTRFEYKSRFTSRPTRIELADGREVRFSYDIRGNVTEATAPGGAKTTFTYDSRGRVTQVKDPRGALTRFVRDRHGYVLEVHEDGVGTTSFLRDQVGQILKVKRPDGRLVTVTRDKTGRAVKVADALGSVWEVSYDARGRVTRYKNEQGKLFRYSYDKRGDLVKVRDAGGAMLSFSHDAAGQVTGILDAKGNRTQIKRLPKGVVEVSDPTAGKRTIKRDAAGRLLEEARGKTRVRYEYDKKGQLVVRHTPSGKERFRYDGFGRMVGMQGPQGGFKLGYDANGRLASLTNTALNKSVKYRYNTAGDRVGLELPWGKVGYRYDTQGRVIGVDLPKGGKIEIEVHRDGRRKSIRYPNGVKTQFVYKKSRLKAVLTKNAAGKELDRRVYGYDGQGRVSWIKDANNKKTTYTHDARGRLVKAVGPQGTVTWSYDAAGNRIAESRGGVTTGHKVGAGNRILSAGKETFTYTASGAISARKSAAGTTRYHYNHDDKLVRVEKPGGEVVRYGYAPNGTRTWRSDKDGRVDFLHDMADVVGEYRQGVVSTTFVHGPGDDDVLAARKGQEWYFYHYDLVRSVTSVTGAKGRVAARYGYTPFGKATLAKGDAAGWNPYRYTSRAFDGATGLYHYRARTYSPELGRFTTPDPVGMAGGVNLYAYVENDPLMFNDPTGLWPGWLDRAWEATKDGVSSAASWTYKKVLTPIGHGLSYTGRQLWAFTKGFGKGLWGAAVGIYNMVRHPIETFKAIYAAIENWDETKEIFKAKWEEYKNAAMNDPEKFAEMTGALTAEILTAVVGTKGLGALSKSATVARAGSKVAAVSRVAASPITRTAARAGGGLARRFPRAAAVVRRGRVISRARDIEKARRLAAGGNVVARTGRRVANVGRDIANTARLLRRPGAFLVYSGIRLGKTAAALVAATGRGIWKVGKVSGLPLLMAFEDNITDAIKRYENRQAAMKPVTGEGKKLLRDAAGLTPDQLASRIEILGKTYTSYRNRLMQPIHDEDMWLKARMAELDKLVESGELADDALDARLAALFEKYNRRRHEHMEVLYDGNREESHDMLHPSMNRTISFQDEIDLLEAIKKKVKNADGKKLLDARIADVKALMEYEYGLKKNGDFDILIAGIAGVPRAPGETPDELNPDELEDLGLDGLDFDPGMLDRMDDLLGPAPDTED